jgi:hypothetical protein
LTALNKEIATIKESKIPMGNKSGSRPYPATAVLGTKDAAYQAVVQSWVVVLAIGTHSTISPRT